jgi:hypothetical protein
MRRLTIAAALAVTLCFTGDAQSQNPLAAMVDRALEELTPAGRAEVDVILAERGITLDDVRSDPALARELMSSSDLQARVKAAMDGPKAEPSPDQPKPAGARRQARVDAQPRGGPVERDAGLPKQYEVIFQSNLFRRLGWEEPRNNPFGLAGVVHRPDGSRALITRQGRPSGMYVEVGADVGDGYSVVSIAGRSVTIAGGPLGEIDLELDQGVIGSRGGGAGSQQREQTQTKKYEAGRWYPARGLSFRDLVTEILDREGYTMQEVENDKELQQSLKGKYQYLEDEGYTKFPDD